VNSLLCNLAVRPQTKVAAMTLTLGGIRLDTLKSNLDCVASIPDGESQKANDSQ
jgi:hypothetical protein